MNKCIGLVLKIIYCTRKDNQKDYIYFKTANYPNQHFRLRE